MTSAAWTDMKGCSLISNSDCVANNEHGSRRLFQLGNRNRMPAQEALDLRCSVVAVLQADHFGRRAARVCKMKKIGVGCNDSEAVGACVVPDRFVRR